VVIPILLGGVHAHGRGQWLKKESASVNADSFRDPVRRVAIHRCAVSGEERLNFAL